MRVGIPKEIKNNEYRVSIMPNDVKEFTQRGHEVLFERDAGIGSGFFNEEYKNAGAVIVDTDEVYNHSEMIYKVKEILPAEYQYMREGLVIFTYLHSNSNLEMTRVFLDSKVIAISYEDIEDKNKNHPLLKPMSEIAGKGGFIAALNYSQSIHGGHGLMLSRIHGIFTPCIAIIGAGSSGLGAAELASAFGNKVIIIDNDVNKLEEAKYKLPPNTELLYSSRNNLIKALKQADALINCILWDKNSKNHLVFRDDLKIMKPNALIIDVSCDEMGAIETSRPSSHDTPIYKEEGIIHYTVDNIPSAFSKTATQSLSQITLPYALKIADLGVEKALINNPFFMKGLCFYKGRLTLKETAAKFSLPYTKPDEVLNIK